MTVHAQSAYRVFVHIVSVIWIPADMVDWGQHIIKILQSAERQEDVKSSDLLKDLLQTCNVCHRQVNIMRFGPSDQERERTFANMAQDMPHPLDYAAGQLDI